MCVKASKTGWIILVYNKLIIRHLGWYICQYSKYFHTRIFFFFCNSEICDWALNQYHWLFPHFCLLLSPVFSVFHSPSPLCHLCFCLQRKSSSLLLGFINRVCVWRCLLDEDYTSDQCSICQSFIISMNNLGTCYQERFISFYQGLWPYCSVILKIRHYFSNYCIVLFTLVHNQVH